MIMNNTVAEGQAGKKRYTEVDIARGIGILFVVLGHAIKQTEVSAGWIRALTYIIYSFHMPLFFCLSGFVSYRILTMDRSQRLTYIRSRAWKLLIPYFTIGLIYIPVKLKFSAAAVKPFTVADIPKLLIGQNPDVSLWFLYVLFVIELICALVINTYNFRSIWYGSFFLSVAVYWANLDIRTLKYLFFFLAGIWVRLKFEDCRKDGIEDVMGGQALLAFLALVADIAAIIFLYKTTITVTFMLTSLCGIYLTIWIASRLVYNIDGEPIQPGRVGSILLTLGLFSMDIYILHEPVMTVLKLILWTKLGWNYILCTLIIFLAALCLPIPISKWVIRKVRLFRILFFGERK